MGGYLKHLSKANRGKPDVMPQRRHWIWAGIGFTALMLTILWPLLSGRVEPRWDARDNFYPAFTYVSDSIREGRFPLWDPYTSCGFPFHAEPQNPTLNPLALALGLGVQSTWTGFIFFWAIQWWIGGIGMLWLTWHFGGRASGGFLAAVTFALSGFFIGHAQHSSYISIAAWLPWIFGLADRAVKNSSTGFVLLAAAAMGMASLGGYPGLLTFTGFALSLWLGLRFLLPGDHGDRPLWNRVGWLVGTLCAIGLVTLVVWSPVLHAFFTEGAGYTDRISPLSPDKANFGDPFSIPALLSFFFPYASILGLQFMQADISMSNGYIGALAIPLAALWVIKGSQKRRPWWFVGFTLFMFLLSLGGKAGVRTALYFLFPPMRYMRFSAPFRLYWILPLSLAGGLGVSLLRNRPETSRLALLLLAGWSGVALASAFLLVRLFSFHGLSIEGSLLRLLLPTMAILPAGLAVVWLMSSSRADSIKKAVPVLLVLLATVDMTVHLYNNQNTVWAKRDSIRQAESFHKRTTAVVGEPGPRRPPLPFGFFNAQQVIKQSVVQGYTAMKSRGFDEVLSRSRFVEVMQSPRRFWLSPGIETISSDEEALRTLTETRVGAPMPAFIKGPTPRGMSPERVVPGSFGQTTVLYYSPERVELEVDVPSQGGAFLLSTERYAAGWVARIDGISHPVLLTNLYFRGVVVPAGRHLVVWTYEPRLWNTLAGIAFACLLFVTIGGLTAIIRR